MNLTVVGNYIEVTLSARNVRQLLTAFENGHKAGLTRRTEGGHFLVVQVESDEEHYRDREAGPGVLPHKLEPRDE